MRARTDGLLREHGVDFRSSTSSSYPTPCDHASHVAGGYPPYAPDNQGVGIPRYMSQYDTLPGQVLRDIVGHLLDVALPTAQRPHPQTPLRPSPDDPYPTTLQQQVLTQLQQQVQSQLRQPPSQPRQQPCYDEVLADLPVRPQTECAQTHPGNLPQQPPELSTTPWQKLQMVHATRDHRVDECQDLPNPVSMNPDTLNSFYYVGMKRSYRTWYGGLPVHVKCGTSTTFTKIPSSSQDYCETAYL